jgi:hypothetical protein
MHERATSIGAAAACDWFSLAVSCRATFCPRNKTRISTVLLIAISTFVACQRTCLGSLVEKHFFYRRRRRPLIILEIYQ